MLTPLDGLIRETIEYCSQRKAFGAPLIDNQVIHFRLAELQTDVEALRALIYRAVGKYLFLFIFFYFFFFFYQCRSV